MTTFCQRTLDFLYFNNKHNSKAWYAEHKEDFKQYLYAPFCNLVTQMTPDMLRIDSDFIVEPKSVISRLYKDLRFAKDKTSLYRDCMWLTFMRDKNQMTVCPGISSSCPHTVSATVADTTAPTQKVWQVCEISFWQIQNHSKKQKNALKIKTFSNSLAKRTKNRTIPTIRKT